MNYTLIKELVDLAAEFEKKSASHSNGSIDEFKRWIAVNYHFKNINNEPNWEGKERGRSAESAINTLLVHINRYAKSYSKSAIYGSDFSTQEDFIYLINLKAFGEMSKMDLIKKNVHEKSAGMQIINRLITQGWVNQTNSEIDKRSKVLKISSKGIRVLESQMDRIRQASDIVTGDLTQREKMDLIRLLNRLNDFHQPIYHKNMEPANLLNEVLNEIK